MQPQHGLAFRTKRKAASPPPTDLDRADAIRPEGLEESRAIRPCYGLGLDSSQNDDTSMDIDEPASAIAAPLAADLSIGFCIYTQHTLAPHSYAGDCTSCASYMVVTLGPEVFQYLSAMKYGSLHSPPKPGILDKSCVSDLKKALGNCSQRYWVAAEGKGMPLDSAHVTWEDVVLAVYFKPPHEYRLVCPQELHDEYCLVLVEMRL